MTSTGFTSQVRARLCMSRLARSQHQATVSIKAGGQTQPSAFTTESGDTSRRAPATAMKRAGATAQRWG